jgi:hypothetical protein
VYLHVFGGFFFSNTVPLKEARRKQVETTTVTTVCNLQFTLHSGHLVGHHYLETAAANVDLRNIPIPFHIYALAAPKGKRTHHLTQAVFQILTKDGRYAAGAAVHDGPMDGMALVSS